MTSFDLIPEHREPPDLERFVAALVAFTLARLEAEKQSASNDSRPAEERDD